MRQLWNIIRYLDRGEDIAMFFICILLLLTGMYALYDSYLVYRGADAAAYLKYKSDYGDDDMDKEIQGNMVAWLTLEDTAVDYPVMQGEDNTEYLTKNPFGEYSLSGSIFLDSRNNPDFTDEYSLIYGHHMERGAMFGTLDQFLDKEYFDSHKNGKLTVGDVTYTIRIFAVIETEATQKAIFAPTETDMSDTLDYIEGHAVFLDKDVMISGEAPVIGLSTCSYPDTVGRTVVFGILYQDGILQCVSH